MDGHGTGGDTADQLPPQRSDFDTTRQSALRTQLSYGEDTSFTTGGGKYYSDPSTSLAISKGYFIEVYHIISNASVFFKAFLTDFTDDFITNYNKEQAFGRSDPIQTYQNTERVIMVAFDLVSSNINEARANMIKANNLISMMYPSYESTGTANSIKSGPLFKVKMGNLICRPGLTEADGMSPAMTDGLSCTIGGFKYSPIIEDGFFDPKPGIFYPQTIKIDLELSILHDEPLGYKNNTALNDKGVEIGGQIAVKPGFPYGGDLALSLNGELNNGTGDVRADFPSEVRGGPRITAATRDAAKADLIERGAVISNVYVRQENHTREAERAGIRSWARLEGRVASERVRVQANKILSPQNRNRAGNILSDPEGTYDDFIIKGHFPE
jgi:hypothetical protein